MSNPGLDQPARSEIATIAVKRRKAFVYAPASHLLAVGNSIHAVWALQLGVSASCAGFLEVATYERAQTLLRLLR